MDRDRQGHGDVDGGREEDFKQVDRPERQRLKHVNSCLVDMPDTLRPSVYLSQQSRRGVSTVVTSSLGELSRERTSQWRESERGLDASLAEIPDLQRGGPHMPSIYKYATIISNVSTSESEVFVQRSEVNDLRRRKMNDIRDILPCLDPARLQIYSEMTSEAD